MNLETLYFFLPAISCAVTFFILMAMLKMHASGVFSGMFLDMPNERSLHTLPVPRFGGIAIMAGILIASVALPLLRPVILIAVTLAILSAVDDLKGLSPVLRFSGHIAGAFVFSVHALYGCPVLLIVLATVCVTWMVNLFNFMDGSDGLAGGMGFWGFLFYGICAIFAQHTGLAILCMCVSGACLGFLCFNFAPARVFMGDAGSVSLGFLSAATGITGMAQGIWSLWFPVAVFSPFIVDATVTLIKRIARGEKIWLAHRSHYYQRLVQMGFSHRLTALLYYLLMAGSGAGAVMVKMNILPQKIFIIFLVLIYLILMALVDKKWSYHLNSKLNKNICK